LWRTKWHWDSIVSHYFGISYQYHSKSAICDGQSGTGTVLFPITSVSHTSIIPIARFVADKVALGQYCIPLLRYFIPVSFQKRDLWRTKWQWDSIFSHYFGISYQYHSKSAICGGQIGTGTVLFSITSVSHTSIIPKARFVGRTKWHWDSTVFHYFGISYQYHSKSAICGGRSGTGTVLFPITSVSHTSIIPKARFVADEVALGQFCFPLLRYLIPVSFQ